jgi:hypothetical protein
MPQSFWVHNTHQGRSHSFCSPMNVVAANNVSSLLQPQSTLHNTTRRAMERRDVAGASPFTGRAFENVRLHSKTLGCNLILETPQDERDSNFIHMGMESNTVRADTFRCSTGQVWAMSPEHDLPVYLHYNDRVSVRLIGHERVHQQHDPLDSSIQSISSNGKVVSILWSITHDADNRTSFYGVYDLETTHDRPYSIKKRCHLPGIFTDNGISDMTTMVSETGKWVLRHNRREATLYKVKLADFTEPACVCNGGIAAHFAFAGDNHLFHTHPDDPSIVLLSMIRETANDTCMLQPIVQFTTNLRPMYKFTVFVDGTEFVFLMSVPGQPNWFLYVMKLAGTRIQQIRRINIPRIGGPNSPFVPESLIGYYDGSIVIERAHSPERRLGQVTVWRNATRPWSTKHHHSYTDSFREKVFLLMLVFKRLGNVGANEIVRLIEACFNRMAGIEMVDRTT